MNELQNRINKYSLLSKKLSELSDEQIVNLLSKADEQHTGIGGKSFLIYIDDIPVFVKKVKLTEIDQLPENINSTANIYNLPLNYQYGVGSTGFGAWRELAAHEMTTEWVLQGECENFPIMYHSRILPSFDLQSMNSEELQKIENDVHFWGNNESIRSRLEALRNSSANIYLFLEYIPQNLYSWLTSEIRKGGQTAISAIQFVDKNLALIKSFMREKCFIHFDAHFENFLTDGEHIYLSDFGLANSLNFNLSKDEIDFLQKHLNYDECCSKISLVHAIITSIYGKENWIDSLRKFVESEDKEVHSEIESVVIEYSDIAFKMNDFFQKIRKEKIKTEFNI